MGMQRKRSRACLHCGMDRGDDGKFGQRIGVEPTATAGVRPPESLPNKQLYQQIVKQKQKIIGAGPPARPNSGGDIFIPEPL